MSVEVDLQQYVHAGHWCATITFSTTEWGDSDAASIMRDVESVLPILQVGRFGNHLEIVETSSSAPQRLQVLLRGARADGPNASAEASGSLEVEVLRGFGRTLETLAAKRRASRARAPLERNASAHDPASAGWPSPAGISAKCPQCGTTLVLPRSRCEHCHARIHAELIPCPACTAPNVVVLDDGERPCQRRSCGEYLSAARLLGWVPAPQLLCEALRATASMSSYHMRRTARGETRVDYVDPQIGEPAVAFLSDPELLDDPVLTEERRGIAKIPPEVRLPSDVRTNFLDGRPLVYYRYGSDGPLADFETWARREPAESLESLLRVVRAVVRAGYTMPALSPEDLAHLDGHAVIRHGHRLHPSARTVPLTKLQPWDPDPELEPSKADLLRACLLWYRAIVGDLLGLRADDPELASRLLGPLVRIPTFPQGVWAAVQPVLSYASTWTIDDALAVLEHGRKAPVGQWADCAGHSDCGRKRDANQEDRFILLDCPFGHLCVVADGVSRSGWGEVAAQIVVDAFRPLAARDEEPTPDDLIDALQRANRDIGRHILGVPYEHAQAEGQYDPNRCMSTTAVAAFVRPHKALIVSVGDSACLLERHGGIEALVIEHSQRMLEVREQSISIPDAWASEGATSLERYVGLFELDDEHENDSDRIDPARPSDLRALVEVVEVPLYEGDVLILCSDGVTDFLTPLDAIKDVIESERNANKNGFAARVAHALVHRAVERQPPRAGDNTTAIVVAISREPRLPVRPPETQKDHDD